MHSSHLAPLGGQRPGVAPPTRESGRVTKTAVMMAGLSQQSVQSTTLGNRTKKTISNEQSGLLVGPAPGQPMLDERVPPTGPVFNA